MILGQAAQIGSPFRSARTEELGLQGSTIFFTKAELSPGQAVQPGVNSSSTCPSWFHCGFTLSPSDAVWNSASSCPLMRHALVTQGRNQGRNQGKTEVNHGKSGYSRPISTFQLCCLHCQATQEASASAMRSDPDRMETASL